MASLQRDSLHDVILLLAKLAPVTVGDMVAAAIMVAMAGAYLLADYTWNKPSPYQYIWYERPQDQDAATRSATRATRNVAQRLEELGKEVVVFWGSQSGTAESFAKRLARELSQRLRLTTMSADLSDFDPETLPSMPQDKIAIFILATYGEGDPSDNANQFWEWMSKAASPSSLSSLRYAALGLGNSNYLHYNRVVDVIDGALQRAGAQRLLPVGKADDAHGGTEEDFCRWKDSLFAFLASDLGINEQAQSYEPMLSAVYDTSMEPIDLHLGEPIESRGKSSTPKTHALPIKHARELFTDSKRSCLHLELDLSKHPELVYKTGDHLGIWPVNPDQEVDRLIRVLGLAGEQDSPLLISALDPAVKVHLPNPTTVNALFRYYVEICAPVSRELARAVSDFAPSPEVKTWVLELCATRDSYSSFLERNYITFGRLLELSVGGENDLIWSGIPLAFVLENLPATRPRYYSISSSSVLSPRSVSITALVSNTSLSNEDQAVPGVTTNYLLAKANARQEVAISHSPVPGLSYHLPGLGNILNEAKIFAHIHRSTLKLPTQPSCPLIMLAAGTGLAPFRAFIAERCRLQSMGRQIGDMLLFFGCRHPDEDYIYSEELAEMEAALGGKLQITVAFSRLRPGERTYIQDKMIAHGADLCHLVGSDASVYICGRASMARDAGRALGEAIGGHRGMNGQQIQDWVATMKRTRKWQEDVWG
ncbi:NADPH--hemoprotein reductase [Purpureocillium takamizusanense]|uniref:NADPH--cytochrome P450 reductase n=1 Tax=Purpureocillium takamizusanense TaxID=2060973 RepID=A0A9Q8Q9A0_9HYPO|nr:NADPH--hemoprotein reductase [Purpureocillium takamizusanense]UNI15405.1 NADPH--hemoprotein reductase [Purpureocillium takamizusanense]